ncbi:hypothetical protein BpHYR1_000040 [Brachionus plicatilis]|uniref:Uncharacterized protein n=1 Tax=Brachionus plicatilis TaxID=10195 RepID=A0A3M7QJT7_BRAPC|nr:hypothetical protein BpHYR1_000040 [Brachionus plicatilis]
MKSKSNQIRKYQEINQNMWKRTEYVTENLICGCIIKLVYFYVIKVILIHVDQKICQILGRSFDMKKDLSKIYKKKHFIYDIMELSQTIF